MSRGITVLIGGVRAGKSRRALTLAEKHSSDGKVLFVATAEAFDDEMRRRIGAHQRERAGKKWETLESPLDVATQIAAVVGGSPSYSVVIVDCLTLWVSNLLLTLPDDADAEQLIADQAMQLLHVLADLRTRGARVILVTNEVGFGVVPPTSLGRRYRDALGRVNQLVAEASDETILMVAGLEMRIK
jgi:adenosylcobinamide kinase / adenosylcobinamide-phosphate guanylyltransferase